ncbi:MAG: anti-sigma F factor [Faecalibacillus sp.]
MKNEMILSFSASLENEPFARTCIASFIASLNPTIDEIVEVKTIVGEAVSNAIIHGYNCDAKQTVYIQASIHEKTLMIKVEDEGNGIEDVEEAKKPMFTSKKELEHAGMGLSIIEALCDKMEICSYLGFGTQLIMIKEFHDEKRRND